MNKIECPAGKNFAMTRNVMVSIIEQLQQYELFMKNTLNYLQPGHGVILSGCREIEGGYYGDGLIFFNNELLVMKEGDASTTNFEIKNEVMIVTGTDANGNEYSTTITARFAQFSATGAFSFSDLHRMPLQLQRKRFELSAPSFSISGLHGSLIADSDCAYCQTDNRTGLFHCTAKLRVVADLSGVGDIELFTLPPYHSLPSHPSSLDRFYFTIYSRVLSNGINIAVPAYVDIATRKVYIYSNQANYVFSASAGDLLYLDFGYYTDYVII